MESIVLCNEGKRNQRLFDCSAQTGFPSASLTTARLRAKTFALTLANVPACFEGDMSFSDDEEQPRVVHSSDCRRL